MKYIILSLSFIILLVSCQKTTTTQNREDMLRTGKWKITAAQGYALTPMGRSLTGDFLTGVNTTVTIPGCNQDDYFIFGPDYSGTLADGGTKCTPGDPDGIQFTWAPFGADAGISIYGLPAIFIGQNVNNGKFSYFSDSKFILNFSFMQQDPIDYTKNDTFYITYTFNRI